MRFYLKLLRCIYWQEAWITLTGKQLNTDSEVEKELTKEGLPGDRLQMYRIVDEKGRCVGTLFGPDFFSSPTEKRVEVENIGCSRRVAILGAVIALIFTVATLLLR